MLRTLVLLTPSAAAAVELPRRAASSGRALAGIYAFKLDGFARAVAEPALLGRGLSPWEAGHAALLAARLLDGPHGLRLDASLPRTPVAIALARTLQELRAWRIEPNRLETLAETRAGSPEDAERLRGLAGLLRGFLQALEGRFADRVTFLEAAREHLREARWLDDAEVLVVGEAELDPPSRELLAAMAALTPLRRVASACPAGLRSGSLAAWAEGAGIGEVPLGDTLFAPLEPATSPEGLRRLRTRLFEPPEGEPSSDGSVELFTAAGEASEVRSVVRRLLREAARGVPFEDMGVLLPRPDPYATLFTDLLARLGVPHRLHPSLPLAHGRCARSLQLLFRSRNLERSAVLEFLTFAPIPFAELLGDGVVPRRGRWDAVSRDAGIVAGYERWIIGLRAYAEGARESADGEAGAERRERLLSRAADAEALLRVVELLHATLVGLAGEAGWPEWSERLRGVLDQWVGPEKDREAVAEVLADLGTLGGVAGGRASWNDVEAVIEARFEWERQPLEPLSAGAIHVGAFDALAGVPFRVVAIPGLVEGGFPPVLRPDPFLLDSEREALRGGEGPGPSVRAPTPRGPARQAQLSLFDEGGEPPPHADPAAPALPTTQDRLVDARRSFHAALSQATERLLLSYPRADPRSGRERSPSLFFAAAASTLAGRTLGGAELSSAVLEDDLASLPLEDAVDAGERDRMRVLRGGSDAVLAVAAGSPSFKWSHLAARERWSNRMTRFDGLVDALPAEAARKLDPATSPWPVSASSLANYARCGFLYLLRNVLGLEAAVDPVERLGLDPLEQGLLFHEVAEAFLRERRDQGALPVLDDDEARERLLAMAEERMKALVAGTPPRHRLVWEMRWRAFQDLLLRWLSREAAAAERGTPAHFEVAFGTARRERTPEPHSSDPLVVDLGDGRSVRISGKIDRIDARADGSLVLRDYKTGRAPKDEGGVFRGGRELQIPVYVLATRQLFPGRPVSEAFLDYVNGGRPVSFDPESVTGEPFRALLRDITAAIAGGCFVQEPSTCKWCDYTAVCGPQPLIEIRQRFKRGDERVLRYLRLRDYR